MSATFDCPKCGAPLDFEPEPGEKTVECSFCHETVVIPADLRIPLPRVKADHRPSPAKHNRPVTAFIWIGVILLGVFGFFIANSSKDSPSPASDSLVASTDFGSGSATEEASVTLAASSTLDAQATVSALQPLLKKEQDWAPSLSEKFIDNSQKWSMGDVRDDFISGNRSISDGRYIWNVTTVKSSIVYSTPDATPDETDFYASMDIKYITMPDDPYADAGFIFRYSDKDSSWYYYSVNDQGRYYFGVYNGKEWTNLISDQESSAYRPGQTNRLSVGAKGSQFIFLINGEMVDHFVDHNLTSGKIGVAINLPQKDEKAVVQFSNFTVLSAPKP